MEQSWTFETSPIAWRFKEDRSFASFIIGPVGSGKTVPLLMRIMDHGMAQAPSKDGIRRSRFAIIRNTMPELRATTAVTYQQIYPAAHFGDIIWRSPATHIIHPRGTDLQIEVNLIALDKPRDVKKLLSMELTGAAINEVREVPRSVITRLTERVGRYEITTGEATTWSGIWCDTNPPDADHWLYKWHHVERPEGFSFHHQPPGVLEVQPIGTAGAEIVDENFPQYSALKLTSAECRVFFRGKVQRVDCPIEIINATGRKWIVNPWQENLVALSRVNLGSNPLGVRSYYGRALAGKTLEEIHSYLQGVYTFVVDGRRVVPQYNAQTHSREHVPILEDEPILMGMDIGGGTLQPSCIFFQRHPRGPLLVHKEVVCYEMGLKRFADLCIEALAEVFPAHVARQGGIGTAWGGPAGEGRDEIFEVKAFDYLRSRGFAMESAPSQDPKMRAAAIAGPCDRMIDGQPGLVLNSRECPILHKGLMGAWHFKRVQVVGADRYADKPNKNDESHPCDGCGYGFLGAGEFATIGGTSGRRKAITVDGEFDVFG